MTLSIQEESSVSFLGWATDVVDATHVAVDAATNGAGGVYR